MVYALFFLFTAAQFEAAPYGTSGFTSSQNIKQNGFVIKSNIEI